MKSLIIVAVLAGTAAAQPTEVTVDQAIELSRNRPRAAAKRAEIDVSAADVVDARIYPNPTFGTSVGGTVNGVATSGDQIYSFELGIPLLVGHQRKHRGDAARAAVAAKRLEVDADERTVELDIRDKFIALQAAQQRTAAFAAALEDARAVRTIVAGRSSAGASSPYALERIDLAIATLAGKLDDARAGEVDASGDLASAVGIPDWHPRAAGTLRDEAAPLDVKLDPTHPAIAADRAAVTAARAAIDKARADATPTPNLTLQAYSTVGPHGVGVVAGVELPLPLFDRNQGAIARARADAKRLQLEADAHAVELAIDAERASRLLASRRETLAHWREALARLPQIRTMAEASYRAGQGGIVELLDALDAISDAHQREVDLELSVAQAELAVRRAARGR